MAVFQDSDPASSLQDLTFLVTFKEVEVIESFRDRRYGYGGSMSMNVVEAVTAGVSSSSFQWAA